LEVVGSVIGLSRWRRADCRDWDWENYILWTSVQVLGVKRETGDLKKFIEIGKVK